MLFIALLIILTHINKDNGDSIQTKLKAVLKLHVNIAVLTKWLAECLQAKFLA